MRTTLAVLAAALLCVAPLTAHHGWTLDYDSGKPVSVKGVVTKIEWTNQEIASRFSDSAGADDVACRAVRRRPD